MGLGKGQCVMDTRRPCSCLSVSKNVDEHIMAVVPQRRVGTWKSTLPVHNRLQVLVFCIAGVQAAPEKYFCGRRYSGPMRVGGERDVRWVKGAVQLFYAAPAFAANRVLIRGLKPLLEKGKSAKESDSVITTYRLHDRLTSSPLYTCSSSVRRDKPV